MGNGKNYENYASWLKYWRILFMFNKKKASKVFLPNHVFDPAKINEPVPE